jgi:subtilase family serine protease
VSFTIQRILGIAPVIVVGLLLAPAAGLAQVAKPDLVVNSLVSPPGDALPGDSFVVTASVKNNGTGSAGASVTKFFLVPAAGLRKNLKGVQTVGALIAGASAAPPATVTIYSDTIPGPYSLQACANRGDTEVVETNATDLSNCRTASGTITVHAVPDLVMKVVTEPPLQVPQGQGFQATYKVKNTGAVSAAASFVKFYLVPTVVGAQGFDLKLAHAEAVGQLGPGATFTNTLTLTVRAESLPGTYRLKACVKFPSVDNPPPDAVDSDDSDNCLTSLGTVEVTPQPDLVVTKVTVVGAPLTVNQDESLTIKVNVSNVGLLDAAASTLTFRLASIGLTPAKNFNLKGRLAVPPVPKGTIVKLIATPSVDEETTPAAYIVSACVDTDKSVNTWGTVQESSESNNCTPATDPLTVQGLQLSPADLAVIALTPPPATRLPGETFSVTATVKNSDSATGASPDPTTTKFYLVNAVVNPTTSKNLKGVQLVGSIPKGGVDATPVTVEVYADTVPGNYFLQACADGAKELHENNEADNCLTSPSPITVSPVPDLVMTAIGNPPPTIVAGKSFPAATTYSVTNAGGVAALASTAKFSLVSSVVGAIPISLKGTVPEDLALPALNPGQVFNHAAPLKVRPDTPPGSYTLLGCADSGKVVLESDEEDNCKASATTVQVTGLPDLIVSVNLAAASVTVPKGGTVPITVVVKNQGFANAPASTVKVSLVLAPGTAGPIETLLESPVPAVAVAGNQTVPVNATIPSTGVPAADYLVVACVDSAKLVSETTDDNNCGTSVGIIKVQ